VNPDPHGLAYDLTPVAIDPEWELPEQRPMKELTFADVGIFNREQARRAGVYSKNRRHQQRMAVVRSRNAR
jgi:hypothetical protein